MDNAVDDDDDDEEEEEEEADGASDAPIVVGVVTPAEETSKVPTEAALVALPGASLSTKAYLTMSTVSSYGVSPYERTC